MLFNSFEFILFLPTVFLLYWFVFNRSLKGQNLFILIASYVFYGWWDWRFLGLIAFSSIVDYLLGYQIFVTEDKRARKLLLLGSLITNLGILGFFKYYNFFVGSFAELMNGMGFQANMSTLNVLLPVGISFYTFQTLSYTIDVYRGNLKPTKDILQFFAFVSFFPQLVAGPIERASHLLPQFSKKKSFNYEEAISGVSLILYGLFKKIVIADNCAPVVNEIFAHYNTASPFKLILAVVLFAFQIYGDFSGYSDIAIGTGRLFGFDLMTNFRTPYFSRNIAEFWRRWHISLSTWFRDYVYIPLGGSRRSMPRNVFNVMTVFMVSGLWHGANWTFVIWGAINGLLFVPLLVFKKNRNHIDTVAQHQTWPSFREIIQIFSTFTLVCFGWLFFRSDNLAEAIGYMKHMFSNSQSLLDIKVSLYDNHYLIMMILVLLTLDWITRKSNFDIRIKEYKLATRWSIYILLFLCIHFFGVYGTNEFIYFQF